MPNDDVLLANFNLVFHKLYPDLLVGIIWVWEGMEKAASWKERITSLGVLGVSQCVYDGRVPHGGFDIVISIARDEDDAGHCYVTGVDECKWGCECEGVRSADTRVKREAAQRPKGAR